GSFPRLFPGPRPAVLVGVGRPWLTAPAARCVCSAERHCCDFAAFASFAVDRLSSRSSWLWRDNAAKHTGTAESIGSTAVERPDIGTMMRCSSVLLPFAVWLGVANHA